MAQPVCKPRKELCREVATLQLKIPSAGIDADDLSVVDEGRFALKLVQNGEEQSYHIRRVRQRLDMVVLGREFDHTAHFYLVLLVVVDPESPFQITDCRSHIVLVARSGLPAGEPRKLLHHLICSGIRKPQQRASCCR